MCAKLERECAALKKRVQDAQKQLQLQALEEKLIAATTAKTDLKLAINLGKEVAALKKTLAQTTLNVEMCRTLSENYTKLIRRVEDTAWKLVAEKQYDLVERLNAKLEELKALDLSEITAQDTDPVCLDSASQEIFSD